MDQDTPLLTAPLTLHEYLMFTYQSYHVAHPLPSSSLDAMFTQRSAMAHEREDNHGVGRPGALAERLACMVQSTLGHLCLPIFPIASRAVGYARFVPLGHPRSHAPLLSK